MESKLQRGLSPAVAFLATSCVAWIRTNRALFLTILFVGLIALVPLYGILFPPLVDLPEHLLISKLLWEKLSGVSHLDLEISWFLGYRLFSALMMLVIPLCKLAGISLVYLPKIVVMALISGYAIVVVAILCSGLKDKSWQSCTVAVCFSLPAVVCMYSACWFIGFVTYTLAITLLIPAIVLTERFLRSGKLLDACLLFLSLLLVYTAHPFAPTFWLLWCFSRALAAFATQTFFLEWKRLICLGLIFLPILLYHSLATRGTILAPSSLALLTQPAIVSINDWYQYRYRGLLDGAYLKADDAADPTLFAHFAIGLILFAALLALCSPKNRDLKKVMLASIFLIFFSSWINEKIFPIPGGAWLAYDYRFSSTVYVIGLTLAGMVLIRRIPVSTDRLSYKILFVLVALLSVMASVAHLIDVQKAYARYDAQARKYMGKVFKHEEPAGISLPHSRWHPDGTLVRLYVCLEEPDCNLPGTAFYTGYFGDLYPVKLRSTARVLSKREQAIWSSRLPRGPLVGYWKLDEPNPGDACIDSSGNGNTGTAHGTSVVTGKIDRARSFNGNGDYIDIPSINIRDAITVATWVYSDNVVQNGFIVVKNPVNTQWALLLEGKGFLKWRSAGVDKDVVCEAPSNSNWHHIVGRQEGTAGSLYVDGVLRASGNLPALGNGTSSINIGRFDSGDHWYFSGQIDDVRIYNRALADTEIKELFTSGSTSHSQPSPEPQLKNDAGVGDARTF